jgi:uncharacterized membrane protein YkoI
MKPRFALMIAAVLTTFVLVLVGAVINRLIEPSPAELAAATDLSAPPPPTVDLQATTSAREIAYQQQLAEANRRLEEANQQLSQADDALAQPAPPAATDPDGSPPALAQLAASTTISAEQAAAVAIAYLGNSAVKEVRLEDEHGATVYEVRFDNGSRVYVDPASGRVIYAQTEDRDSHSGDNDNDDK